MAGSTGQNRRIEALRLNPVGETNVVVHIKDIGNKEYKNITKDTIIGTSQYLLHGPDMIRIQIHLSYPGTYHRT